MVKMCPHRHRCRSALYALFITFACMAVSFLWTRDSSLTTDSNAEHTPLGSSMSKSRGNYNSPPCTNLTLPNAEAMAENGLQLSIPIPSRALAADATADAPRNFTVLMLVFSRAVAWRELAMHYACMSSVDKMIVLWAQRSEPPAINETSDLEPQQQQLCSVKVVVEKVDSESLTVRFNPQTSIDTLAVFSVDDDILVAESDLNHAFDVWKGHPWGIVGFNQKRYSWTEKSDGTGYYTYGGPDTPDYHFIMTNAAFLHRSYLEMFNTEVPGRVRAEIDRRKNCEDLAMNLLVASFCRCTAAFKVVSRKAIVPPMTVLRPFDKALSSRPRHYIERSECLNSLASVFTRRPPANWCRF